MRKFYVTSEFLLEILNAEETNLLIDFFKEKKYLDKESVLSIRFFMFYQNYFLELPESLEGKRTIIFNHLYKLGYGERDFMQSKADFKKKPLGYKD